MKKTMKYFMFLLVSTMVVFTSCKDDDEPKEAAVLLGTLLFQNWR